MSDIARKQQLDELVKKKCEAIQSANEKKRGESISLKGRISFED